MIAGGCACGAVRYVVERDDVPRAYACHCHVCQRATGSAFAVQAIVAVDGLRVAGPIVTRDKHDCGHRSVQRFCGECHSRLYNMHDARPGIALLRAGTLDRSEEVRVRAHIFTATRQAWIAIPAHVSSWPDRPPPDAFMAAMTGPG